MELVGWVLDPRGDPNVAFLDAWVKNPPYMLTPRLFSRAKDDRAYARVGQRSA
jgi:hypothetical protein